MFDPNRLRFDRLSDKSKWDCRPASLCLINILMVSSYISSCVVYEHHGLLFLHIYFALKNFRTTWYDFCAKKNRLPYPQSCLDNRILPELASFSVIAYKSLWYSNESCLASLNSILKSEYALRQESRRQFHPSIPSSSTLEI